MRRRLLPALLFLAGLTAPATARAATAPAPPHAPVRLSVTPARILLSAPEAQQQLAVSLPGTPRFTVLDPKVARVSADGLVTPVADGVTRVRVRLGGGMAEAPVTVRLRNAVAPSFTRDVHPILSHAGCNGGTCHGKAEGQHGFRLSLFGYDPQFDYDSISRAAEGRRITRTDPGRSLLLLKATSQIPHAGGMRLRPASREYQVIARWIATGTRYEAPQEAPLAAISVFPPERLLGMKSGQRLIVTAKYADGTTRDVTREAKYTSNNPLILNVDETGAVSTQDVPGAAAVMVNYQGLVTVSRVLVPRKEGAVAASLPANAGYIDQLVWQRLARLRIQPSAPATDSQFLRRAYLDLIGTLPTPVEARSFLAECEAERKLNRGDAEAQRGEKKEFPPAGTARARLIDRLLARPEYAEFWALKWSDLLRVNKDALGSKGAYTFYRWIREALAENMPYDRFVREIVAASGSSAENGPVNLYRALSKPDEAASSISQVFLGVRIECAQCHHHPFEKWSQDDYYGMVGFFSQMKTKPDGPHSVVLTAGGPGEVKHPRTGRPVPPHPLGGDPVAFASEGDRRKLLADWMASPANPFVPRMLVNRVWAHFMGRGLVDPVDDFRDSNPPSNPELLDALAKDFVSGGYDVKRLIRTIMTSQAYGLSSQSNPTNAADEQNYSRAYPKRLQAEVLLDAIASATGTPADLNGLPRGTRAIQVWDSEWNTQWQSYFLNVFGRPARTHPCDCERSQEPSIVQVLHLMNAPEIQRQISERHGRARALAESDRTPKQIIEELFLAAYARLPTAKEEATALQSFERAGPDRTRATEDVLWALINTMEFVFNH